jgi:hypothetical protein
MKLWSILTAAVFAVAALTLVPQQAGAQPAVAISAGTGSTAPAAIVGGTSGSLFSFVPKDVTVQPMFDVRPMGSSTSNSTPLMPKDLWDLYGEPVTASALRSPTATSPTIAVVDVGHYATTYTDLVTYRRAAGLPACTSQTACLTEINQSGGTALPPPDHGDPETVDSGRHRTTVYGWQIETNLDVQLATASCPTCHIVLVDANSSSLGDMLEATNAAANWANWVSMSFGGRDDASSLSLSDENRIDQLLFEAHPDVVFTAATDDDGYEGNGTTYQGGMYPATASNVIATGGVSAPCTRSALTQPCTWGTSTVWSNADGGPGSGCAQWTAMPAAQRAITGPASPTAACGARKAENDLAAVADPETGMGIIVAGAGVFGGGTSAAAPVIAGLYAMAGNHTSPYAPYSHPTDFTDITDATATQGCSHARIALQCTGGTGWDGPTGMGLPTTVAAFAAGATPGTLTGAGNGVGLAGTAHHPVATAIRIDPTVSDGKGGSLPLTSLQLRGALPAGVTATPITSGGQVTGIRVAGTPAVAGNGVGYVVAKGVTAAGRTLVADIPVSWHLQPERLWFSHAPRHKGATTVGHKVKVVKPTVRVANKHGHKVHVSWSMLWKLRGHVIHHGASYRLPAKARHRKLVLTVTASGPGYTSRTWRMHLRVQ